MKNGKKNRRCIWYKLKFYVNNMLTVFRYDFLSFVQYNTAPTKDSNSWVNRKHPEWMRIEKKRINGPKYFYIPPVVPIRHILCRKMSYDWGTHSESQNGKLYLILLNWSDGCDHPMSRILAVWTGNASVILSVLKCYLNEI